MHKNKSLYVQELFNDVASNYDLLNDLLSFGLHRIWKKKLLSLLRPKAGEHWLDICCGTGDLALAMAPLVSPGGSILGVDYAQAPLTVAKKKSCSSNRFNICWMRLDALNTGLPSSHFDGAVMGYGLRNLENYYEGLKELRRLLKEGSKAGILDFNPINETFLASKFQKFYLRQIVVPIAARAGLKEHYAYIEKSLEKFPDGTNQEKIAIDAGFKKADHIPIAANQMGILILQG